MASLVLGAAGAIVGSMIAPGIGTSIGWMLGSTLGNMLFPPKGLDGPRLQNLKLSTSAYGGMIPIVYGSFRVPGNVIDQTDLKETKHDDGGKGGPTQGASYTYSASFQVLLCEGPIIAVRRIWMDNTLIYDTRPGATTIASVPIVIYLGDQTQLPSPTFEAIHGVGNVPAYRGRAYIDFIDYQLADWGNRIPSITAEVMTVGHVNAAIHLVLQNNSEPVTWGGGTIYSGIRPVLLQWTSTGNIRVKGDGATTVELYDQTLAHTGSEFANGALDFTPSNIDLLQLAHSHLTWHYYAVGTYLIDGNFIPVWCCPDNPVVAGATFASLAATSIALDGDELPFSGNSFANPAGIPLGEYVGGCSLTQDKTALFVFTAPTSPTGGSAIINKWYMLVNAVVVDHGTVSPAISWDNIKFASYQSQGYAVNQFENNRKWCWFFYGAGVSGGTARVYQIDAAKNFALNAVCDHLDVIDAQSFNFPTCMVIEEGFLGLAFGSSLAIVTRFPLNDVASPTYGFVVGALCARAGLDPTQYDVSQLTEKLDGYMLNNQADCRSAIVQLAASGFFDGAESDARVRFVKRGGPSVATILDADLAADVGGSGSATPVITTVRGQEEDLPATLNVRYVNTAADYQDGTQVARRQVTASQLSTTVDLGISLKDSKAAQIAWAQLFNFWAEREKYNWSTSRKYAYLDPTDVVNAHGIPMRITGRDDIANGVVKFEAAANLASLWAAQPSAMAAIGFVPATPPPSATLQASQLVMLDIPIVIDGDAASSSSNLVYAAGAGGSNATWSGMNLYKSSDGGNSYSVLQIDSSANVIGAATTQLGNFLGGNVFDLSNSVTVVIGAGGGTLSSATELAVLNGANMALIGNEIIRFKNATLIAAKTYTLTGLLRGRRGTEWAIPGHGPSDPFILLPAMVVPTANSELGQTRLYKGVTFGTTLSGANPVPFVDGGAALKCYSPVQLGGGSDASGNVTLNWIRRTRLGGAWLNLIDVPLSEATESYVIQIWDATYTICARILTSTTPTVVYTSAMQVTDFGANQLMIFFSVGQVGAFGLGQQAKGVAAGIGASNVTPLSPIIPYNNPPPIVSSGCTLPVTNSNCGSTHTIVYNTNFTPGGVWVVKFTTPTLRSGAGRLTVAEWQGQPTPRTGVLATGPCGNPVGNVQGSSLGPTNTLGFYFYLQNNPYPSIYPTLAPSTDYYVSITTATASGAFCEYNPP